MLTPSLYVTNPRTPPNLNKLFNQSREVISESKANQIALISEKWRDKYHNCSWKIVASTLHFISRFRPLSGNPINNDLIRPWTRASCVVSCCSLLLCTCFHLYKVSCTSFTATREGISTPFYNFSFLRFYIHLRVIVHM